MKAVRYFIISCLMSCLMICNSYSQDTYSVAPSNDISLKQFQIGTITIIGNKTTKNRIIFRELNFRTGDTLDTLEMRVKFKRSEENLYNTSLFNSVRISWLEEGSRMNIFIIVTERWYVFPLPIFEIAERNFNVWWETKDFSRVVYGGVLTWNNFRGRNEDLAITLRLGYTQRISFFYSIPYINKHQKAGLTFGFAYSRNHQSNVKTIDNTLVFYTDEVLFSKKEIGGSIAYTYRKDLYKTHLIETGYRYNEVLDTVVSLNNDYFTPGESDMKYFILRYFFKSDHRDIAVYPLKGYYIDFEVTKNGFSFMNDDVDIAYVTIRGKKFWRPKKRISFGTGVTAKYTMGTKLPYYLNKALGYGKEFIRGYEFYVIDGQDFVLFKTNLKFTIIPQREIHMGFIPISKFSTVPFAFYFNLYGDLGYVRDELYSMNNPLNNLWQYGFGAGVDLVTYYDMVFRLEYSINKLGETGFFLHFTSPI